MGVQVGRYSICRAGALATVAFGGRRPESLPIRLAVQPARLKHMPTLPTAVSYNEESRLHTHPQHPEHAGRLQTILNLLDVDGIRELVLSVNGRPAGEPDLLRVHSPLHLERVRDTERTEGLQWLDADTYGNEHSWQAARRAAGTVVEVTRQVLAGKAVNGMALVRPPGHHATPDRAMGFCLINNIAVAAAWALAETDVNRVLILDFDVHHGNGIQDIFWRDPSVLFVSLHQSPLYPFTGDASETGGPQAEGLNCNLPLPPGVGDQGCLRMLDEVAVPLAEAFTPDLILVSAGYDGHWLDPLAQMQLTVAGYTAMVRRLMELAAVLCRNRLVLVLEGGYRLEVLAHAVVNSIAALAGEDGPGDPFGLPRQDERDIAQLIAGYRSQWFGGR